MRPAIARLVLLQPQQRLPTSLTLDQRNVPTARPLSQTLGRTELQFNPSSCLVSLVASLQHPRISQLIAPRAQ